MNKNNQNIQETLANYLRNYLEQHNLTQQALADQINAYFSKNIFPQPRINKLIAKNVMPQSYTFFLLCDFFRIHSSELFPITESPTKIYQSKKCLETTEKFKSSLQMHLNSFIEKKAVEYCNYQSNAWIAIQMTEELRKQNPEFPPINPNTIQRYRHNGRNMPLDFLIALCQVLKVEASDLID